MKNKLTKTGVLILIGLLFTLGWSCQLSGPSAPATPKEEKLIDVSFVVGEKGGLQSKSLSGMIVYAKSFSTIDRTQLGTTRTLTENPSGSGRYTGTVSVGDGTAAKATVYIYGVLNNRVRAYAYTDITLPRTALITLPYSTAGYTAGDMGPGGGFIVDVDNVNYLYTELAPQSWKGKASDNIYFWDSVLTELRGTFTAKKKGLDNVTLLKAAITTDDYWTEVKTIKVNAGGSGYLAADKLKLTGGDGTAEATIAVTNGVIKTLYDVTFAEDDKLAPVAPSTTSTITVEGGTDYAVDDVLNLVSAGAGLGAKVKVKAVLNDVVIGITCFDAGDGYKAGDKVIVGGTGGPEVTIDSISGTGTTGPIATYHLSSLAYGRSDGHNLKDNKGTALWDIELWDIADGVISKVELTNPGTGYAADEVCKIAGDGHGNNDATFKVKEVTNGIINAATIDPTKKGKNYNKGPCAFTGGSGTGASLEITAVDEYAYAIHAFRNGIDFNGFDDWTFPTKGDLDSVHATFGAGDVTAGLTAGNKYWSSSEVAAGTAHTLVVGTGVANTEPKATTGLYVRPVRYF